MEMHFRRFVRFVDMTDTLSHIIPSGLAETAAVSEHFSLTGVLSSAPFTRGKNVLAGER